MLRLLPALCLALLAPLVPIQAEAPSRKGKPAEVFVQDKVWNLHLTISADHFKKMEPARGGQPGGGMGGPGKGGFGKGPAKAKDLPPLTDDRQPRGLFGFDFEYVKADLDIDGLLLKDVAVRFKGSGTYLMSQGQAKRPFKIDLNRHIEGQAFKGVRSLTLNNNVMDPTATREALAYKVFRAAGVPAPRTAYAAVSLTVPGKYDNEFLGLYTLVESVDKPFLRDHFGSTNGVLVKPENVGPLDYLGEEWKAYQERYRPKSEVDEKTQKRIIAFIHLVQRGTDAAFREQIDSYLDVDRFLRFLAGTVLLSAMDSFIGLNHNWYAYLDPKTNKVVFIPWDLDLAFGAFFPVGSGQELMTLSIRRPYSGTNKLIERLFADEKRYAAYTGHLKQLMKSGFTAESLKSDLAAVKKAIEPSLAKEKKAAAARKEGGGMMGGMGGMFANAPAIETFVAKRIESVESQLAGKTTGFTPRSISLGGGPGKGPGKGPGPGGFNPASPLTRPVLNSADKDKDGKLTKDEAIAAAKALFALCEAKDGTVDQSALAKALDKIMPKQGGGFGGFTPPSQAPQIARRVIERAGKRGKLTEASLTAATETVFTSADRNKDGKLDEQEIGEALRGILPAPPFGPGGFNPAMFVIRPALEAADGDIDGRLTKAEVTAAIEALFALCASDKTAEVDQATITKAIDKILPKQQGFGGFNPPSQAPQLARRVVERAGKRGKVTLTGMKSAAGQMFATADANQDGVLDEAELGEALRGLMPVPAFGPGGFNPAGALVRPALEAADADIDGRLTKAEMTASLESLFAAADPDKKGEVTEAMLVKALEKIVPKQQGFGGFTPQSPAPGMATRIVGKAGKDGKMTKAQFLAQGEKLFAAADKDKDGRLDEAELAEALRELVAVPQFGPR